MAHLLATSSALPANYYRQAELVQGFLSMCADRELSPDAQRVRELFEAVKVDGRYLALPLARYAELGGFAQRNREWLRVAVELGERAVSQALLTAGLRASDVQLFASSTVTGLAVPSLDARLMNRLGFATDCRRMPLFGLGCVAGAAGLARVSDYLASHPTHAALLLCVELCSLTFQPGDVSMANLVACGLFGDGAACVVLVGREHALATRARASIEESRSVFFPNTEDVMGWEIVDSGFRVVLSRHVPELARTALATSVRGFLAERGLSPAQVVHWIAHPGGPAVMDAMEAGLELPTTTLRQSRECLARIGNLSSVSVLVILEEAMSEGLSPGSAVLLAMGPGFCAELLLLQC